MEWITPEVEPDPRLAAYIREWVDMFRTQLDSVVEETYNGEPMNACITMENMVHAMRHPSHCLWARGNANNDRASKRLNPPKYVHPSLPEWWAVPGEHDAMWDRTMDAPLQIAC